VDVARGYAGDGGLHVVLGASGGVGGAVVRELVACGRRVRGVTRSGQAQVHADVDVATGDRHSPPLAVGL
jgi:uncharacterized protein YbjT (DUF2867 family)